MNFIDMADSYQPWYLSNWGGEHATKQMYDYDKVFTRFSFSSSFFLCRRFISVDDRGCVLQGLLGQVG